MKVYLVRHGETTGDVEDRYGGSYDDHMTPAGFVQVKASAEKLIGKSIELIVSSSMIRAKEAADIIQSVLNCPIEIIDGFKERGSGVLAGLIKAEAKQKHPDLVELNKDPKNTMPQGESYDDSYARVVRAFKSVTEKDHKVVAIVTHGGPIRYIHRELGKGELSELGHGDIFELDV